MEREIFISYSRNDKAVVLPYVKQINEAVGRNCWIDLKGIESGVEFEEVIINAINDCQVVLFMLSDSSLRSKWTKREVIYAEGECKRIVPVLVNGNKLRGWFKFHFGNVDFIDIRSEEQKEKLIRNLRTWLGMEEDAKCKAEEEAKREAEKEKGRKAKGAKHVAKEEVKRKAEETNLIKKWKSNQSVSPLNPFTAIPLALSRLFDFKGKSSLSEFWWNIPLLTFLLLSCLIYSQYNRINIVLESISVLLVFIMSGICVRRLHDTNRTGWWVVFPVCFFGNFIIPFIPQLIYTPFELCFASFSFLVLFFCGQDSARKQKLKALSFVILFFLLFVLMIYLAWACIPFFNRSYTPQEFYQLLFHIV